MRRLAFLLTAVIVTCAPAGAKAKDLVLHQRTVDPGNVAREVTQYWTDTKTVSDGPTHRTIVDYKAKTLTLVDKSKQTYTTTTFDEMRQRAAALQKQIQGLPPDARNNMGALADESPVTLKPTGKSEKIAGYEAKEYAIEGNKISGAVWITDAIDVSARAQEWQKAMGGKSPPERIAAAVAGIKGLPLRIGIGIVKGDITNTSITEVVEVSETAPPADVLAIPKGFAKATTTPVQ